MIHDVNSQYYLKILLWGSANLGVPIFGATFVTDNPNLEPTTPNVLDNIDCKHYGSSRVLSWDHFKLYSSRFEPVVWILET